MQPTGVILDNTYTENGQKTIHVERDEEEVPVPDVCMSAGFEPSVWCFFFRPSKIALAAASSSASTQAKTTSAPDAASVRMSKSL